MPVWGVFQVLMGYISSVCICNVGFTQSVQTFNGSLTISQASLNDQGVYECIAHNALATHDGPATIVTMIGKSV